MRGTPKSIDARAVERCAGAISALAALVLIWTRLLPLSQSLSANEASGIEHYVSPGPGSVFESYGPGNHGLFALLTWLTVTVTRDLTTPAYRFWSVVPALAAAAILAWWLWRRLDRWDAATFLVLAAAAPPYLHGSIEAGGYGLAFLAAALLVIATDSVLRERTARGLMLFTASAIVGIWSLPVFGLAVLPCIVLLALRPERRRDAAAASGMIAVAGLAFYAPVLGGVWNAAGRSLGPRLSWHGAVSRPLDELLAPVVRVLAPRVSVTAAAIIGGVLVAAGVLVLWRRSERILASVLLLPALFGYLVLELGRFHASAHFFSFLELPLLVLAAAGITASGRAMLRGKPMAVVVLTGAVGLSGFALIRANTSFQGLGRSATFTPGFATQAPQENFSGAASLIDAAHIGSVVTTSSALAGLDHYLETAPARALDPRALASTVCSDPTSFAYVEQGEAPTAVTACLKQRRAFAVHVPSVAPITVWFVTNRQVS